MLIVKIKICGLTNFDDAAAAIDMGADMLGFNFFPSSPRYISFAAAADIVDRLPGFVDIAGVFVNAEREYISEGIERCQLNWVQLHGDESVEECRQLLSMNVKTIKALRVRSAEDIAAADEYFTDAVLLDAFEPGKYGGTGRSFDWNIIGHMKKRVFLAGGINPDNIAEAVEIGVYGIDVCSGVESAPGRKDHAKMQKLFDNISHLRG